MAELNWSDRIDPSIRKDKAARRAVEAARTMELKRRFPGNDMRVYRARALFAAEDELLAAQEHGDPEWLATAQEEYKAVRDERV